MVSGGELILIQRQEGQKRAQTVLGKEAAGAQFGQGRLLSGHFRDWNNVRVLSVFRHDYGEALFLCHSNLLRKWL